MGVRIYSIGYCSEFATLFLADGCLVQRIAPAASHITLQVDAANLNISTLRHVSLQIMYYLAVCRNS